MPFWLRIKSKRNISKCLDSWACISLIIDILVREAQEKEDQNLHKIVTDVIEGKKRTRRRNGATTLDDSESEDDEEEENARRRRRMYKRARTGDGHLAALGTYLEYHIAIKFSLSLQRKMRSLLPLLMGTSTICKILLNMTSLI